MKMDSPIRCYLSSDGRLLDEDFQPMPKGDLLRIGKIFGVHVVGKQTYSVAFLSPHFRIAEVTDEIGAA